MANVSYLRAPRGSRAQAYPSAGRGAARPRRRAPWVIGGVLLLVVLGGLAAGAFLVASSKASLVSRSGAIAEVDLPLGGGTVDRVSVIDGVQNRGRFVRVHLRGDPIIVPAQKIASGEKLTVTVVVRRPGWISWLSGKTETLTRTVRTPSSVLRTRYVTLTRSGALRVRFSAPVRSIAYGSSARTLTRHSLDRARRTVTIPHRGTAGILYLSAAAQRWETAGTSTVNWFPTGTRASVVAQPSSGRTISSDTPITLSFSKPVSAVLGKNLPIVSPAHAGAWRRVSSHEIRFMPSGYGYGLGAKVRIALPSGVRFAGAASSASASTGSWNVPGGSTVRLQQLLAQLGFLPLTVHYHGAAPASTVAAQEIAAEQPPSASLVWTYADTPAGLKREWDGAANATVMTEGALDTFQADYDLEVTGFEDAETWNALFHAAVENERNTFGYTFVSVSENLPESLFLWHSGKMVLSDIPVNTGVAGATTQTGTFPVFEHAPSVTMIGTDVDGTKYDDPDIKWVSYFNGGDALHEYPRASYGSPQSNGCVEMDATDAQQVYPYTPIGTLVQVNS